MLPGWDPGGWQIYNRDISLFNTMASKSVLEKALPEKLEVGDDEDAAATPGTQAFYRNCVDAFTPSQQKKIMRRIDRRLVLTLGLLYAVSLMDRNNTGNAMIAGMDVDLVMTGPRYSIVVLLFFIPYTLLQPAATALLRVVGPRAFLATTTFVWGFATITSGFVKNWSDLIPIRLILGVCEAGFFPGCAYILSCWYPRYELQKRNAVFYAIGTTAAAFAGPLAYAFSQLDGSASGPSWWGRVVANEEANGRMTYTAQPGIAGWRWIFILQGTLTCAFAFIAYLLIMGFPDVADSVCGSRLDNKEASFIVARIELDRQDASPEKFSLKSYLAGALDLKIWGFAALFGLTTVNTYALAYFFPLILRNGMGFSIVASQCLIAPPYVSAGIVMFTMAWLSDKYRIRSPFIIFNGCLLILGLCLLGFTKNTGLRYFGGFITTTACNANVPCIMTWQANNIRGQWKRALCSATLVGTGGIGGVIGATVFRDEDAPEYLPGIYTSMGASVLIIVITLMLDWKFIRANKKVAAGQKVIGDLDGFRYTL